MLQTRINAIALCVAILLGGIPISKRGWSQASELSIQDPDDLTVLLVDSDSQPVADAKIGFSASYGDSTYQSSSWIYLPDPESQERFPNQVRSDKRGIATFRGGKSIANKFRVSLIARHDERQLSGVVNLPRTASKDAKITLYPECKITGTMECRELVENNIELERNWLNVSFEGLLCVEHYSLSPDFELFLPPGKYSLTASGADDGTLIAERSFVIPEGVAEMQLYPVLLSLKGSKRLAGLPAPDLTHVIAWKGDGPKSLQDLKGNVVLLDSWGYWCHACIAKIPRLIELDNRYRDRGLQILGLHIDAGDRITSLAEYDAYAKTLETGILKGKTIPYPIALLADKPTPFRGNSAKKTTCKAAADYGVTVYPTMILIGRSGNIVGEFRDTPEGLATLKKLFNAPEATDKPRR